MLENGRYKHYNNPVIVCNIIMPFGNGTIFMIKKYVLCFGEIVDKINLMCYNIIRIKKEVLKWNYQKKKILVY